MARKIKIDNATLKKFSRNENKRKAGGKPLRKYYLIVCEGKKTEPNYFISLKDKLPKGVANIEIVGEGKNTLSLLDKVISIRDRREKGMGGRKFDHVWAVFDRDSFPDDHFDNAISRGQSLKPQINCAWSNESFELWYLLHLEFIDTPVKRQDFEYRIERKLTELTGKKFSYSKNREDMYDILQRYGNETQAITRAEFLENKFEDFRYHTHNPCTRLHVLIKALNELKKNHHS